MPSCTIKSRGTGAAKVTSLSCPVPGAMAPGSTWTFNPTFTVTAPGDYVRTATAYMAVAKDGDATNNSISVTESVAPGSGPPPPSKTPFQVWLQGAQIQWMQFQCLLRHIHC
jgi:hypothetical protein